MPPPNPPRPPPSDPHADWPVPQLVLRCDDLAHPGAQLFFAHVRPLEAMRDAVLAVYCWLYTPESVPREVEKILLVLRPMPGVAHTFGSAIYKEIHLSLDHIQNCAARAADEVRGVLAHEMVHCFQFTGVGVAFPGGLGEGIADWVRLHASLAPPHWRARPGAGTTWDAGYEATAFFLEWLEARYGHGVVAELNGLMRVRAWDERVFKELTGRRVGKLWVLYCEEVEGAGGV